MQEDDDTLEATGTLGTPKQRARSLIWSLIPSVAFGLIGMGVSFALSAFLSGWLFTTPPTERYRQLPEGDASVLVAHLSNTSRDLAELQTLVASQPEAFTKAKNAQDDVNAAIQLLNQLPLLERQAKLVPLPSLITEALADDLKPSDPRDGWSVQDIIALGLTGFIALMFLVFVILYFKTEDKTKKVFAEKIMTSMVGFMFGLLTGSLSGRYK